MSKYTTEVRFICEQKSGFVEAGTINDKSVDEVLEAAHSKIFNFSYPIFDNSYKSTLECKILKHYYTREIASETVGLWQLWLNSKMNDIMTKYNKLYLKEREILNKEFKNIDVEINHLRTDDLLKQSDYTRTDNLTHTNTHNDTDKNRFSDTPQGSISFADADTGNVWLTSYNRNDNNGGSTDTNTGTQRNNGTDKNTGTQANDTHEHGYRGGKTYYEMLNEYAEKVLNIDLMIINELQDLFFKLW